MSKSNSSILILIISMLFISNNVVAASYEIEMLNKLEKEKMLFSKKVIKIDINDEVLWKSVDKGHNEKIKNVKVYGKSKKLLKSLLTNL